MWIGGGKASSEISSADSEPYPYSSKSPCLCSGPDIHHLRGKYTNLGIFLGENFVRRHMCKTFSWVYARLCNTLGEVGSSRHAFSDQMIFAKSLLDGYRFGGFSFHCILGI